MKPNNDFLESSEGGAPKRVGEAISSRVTRLARAAVAALALATAGCDPAEAPQTPLMEQTLRPDQQGIVDAERADLKSILNQYLRLPEQARNRATWGQIRESLLADREKRLKQIEKLNALGGAILFGIDAQGNALISNNSDAAPYIGLNIREAKAKVAGEGFELFPAGSGMDLSQEVMDYEAFTGRPFSGSPEKINGASFTSSWIDSPDEVQIVERNIAATRSFQKRVPGGGERGGPTRGARPLLRISTSKSLA